MRDRLCTAGLIRLLYLVLPAAGMAVYLDWFYWVVPKPWGIPLNPAWWVALPLAGVAESLSRNAGFLVFTVITPIFWLAVAHGIVLLARRQSAGGVPGPGGMLARGMARARSPAGRRAMAGSAAGFLALLAFVLAVPHAVIDGWQEEGPVLAVSGEAAKLEEHGGTEYMIIDVGRGSLVMTDAVLVANPGSMEPGSCYAVSGMLAGHGSVLRRHAPVIDHHFHDAQECISVRHPAYRTVDLDRQNENIGITVVVHRMEFAEEHTRILYTIYNSRDHDAAITRTLLADGSRIYHQNPRYLEGFDTLGGAGAGGTATGWITYQPGWQGPSDHSSVHLKIRADTSRDWVFRLDGI